MLAAALVLAGCSALRLAYSQAPDVAYWWLDGYIDFTGEQTPPMRDGLKAWFGWHRRAELPVLASHLSTLERQVMEPATPGQVCAWFDEGERRFAAALDHAAPIVAGPMLTLTAAQLEHLQRRQTKANEEFRDDFLAPDRAARQARSIERAVDRAEQFYGTLTAEQRLLVERRVAGSPFDPERWDAERRARQADLLDALRQLQARRDLDRAAAREQAETLLRTQGRQLWRSPREAYRGYSQQLRGYNCDFIAQLHNLTTPAQRERARAKLRGWEADLRLLAADAG